MKYEQIAKTLQIAESLYAHDSFAILSLKAALEEVGILQSTLRDTKAENLKLLNIAVAAEGVGCRGSDELNPEWVRLFDAIRVWKGQK